MIKKVNNKKETYAQGVITLCISQIIIKLLGLLYRIYLTNREGFGSEGDGIYSSGYQIYALLLTISSVGVPNSISKLVSERIAVGDYNGGNRIFKISFLVFAMLGLLGTVFLFCKAKVIANYWLKIPDAEMTLVALSPAIFFVSISSVFRGYFNGIKNLKATARSQTLEQIFKTTFTILIVEIVAILENKSTKLMAAGANIATTFATFSSFLYLGFYYKIYKKEIKNEIKQSVNNKNDGIYKIIKMIMLISIPITISAMMSSLNKNIDSVTISRMLQKYQGYSEKEAIASYGIIGGKVDTLICLPLSINIAFSTALVPVISSALARKKTKEINEKISVSLLISIIIGMPCTIGMCVYSKQIINLLYPNANNGIIILQICSFSILFTILSQTITGALQGLGKVMVPVRAMGIGCIVKLLLNIILLRFPETGIIGAAIGTVSCHFVAFIIAYKTLKNNITLDIRLKHGISKSMISTFIMIIFSYLFFVILKRIIDENVAFLITIIASIVSYLIMIMSLKVINIKEIAKNI